jgi:catechol 2,3-dioxygenase-like lactoylglutathione lyase family enzyme
MTVRVADIAFVRFEAPDLDVMESFLTEFGLQRSGRDDETLYMRGTDDEGFVHVTHLGHTPRFVGFAFVAENLTDLEVLSRRDGFSPVRDLAGPGGGKVVRTIDPDGFQIEVVAERGSVGQLPTPASSPRNDARTTQRSGSPLRLDAGPAHVKRLGHCVIDVTDFRASEAWYKEHFGLITSDEIALDETTALGAFMRCDQGDRYVDHHTLFLVGIGRAKFNHAAFEVADFDDLMLGNSHLAAAQHTHQWGIGRHILGSQIYDYWLDPYGHMVEHWTDGDLFNNETPPNTTSLDVLLGSQWGPTAGHPPG